MTDPTNRIADLSPKKRELLLQRLRAQKGQGAARTGIPVQPRTGNAFPLSFGQERLWFLQQLQPGTAIYNNPEILRLDGQLNLDHFTHSINEVICRHEILRTTFVFQNGQPMQIIAAPTPWVVSVIDFTAAPIEDRNALALQYTQTELAKPFDLTHGPLWRTTLISLSETEHIFLLTLHHIITDGWSTRVFVSELAALYTAFTKGKPLPLPEPTLQYADFAVWNRDWLKTSGVANSQLEYWKRQLADPPPVLELPLDWPKGIAPTNRGKLRALNLSKTLTDGVKSLSQSEKATAFMTLLAAFNVLLYRYTGHTDIILGSPSAGRTHEGTQNLMGIFLNTLAFRMDVSGQPTFTDLLARARTVCTQAYANQDVPFEHLLAVLQPHRQLNQSPYFQILFNLLNLPENKLGMPGLTLQRLLPSESGVDVGAKFDLTLYIEDEPGGFQFQALYNTDLYDTAHIDALLNQYQHLLTQIVADPTRPITHYSLVTPQAKPILPDPSQPLERVWSGALHTQISQVAQTKPEQTALADTHSAWTYNDLETISNRLAHNLIAQGIQPGERVAMYTTRTASLVVALLGILKAGAAFVILDSAYPIERLAAYLRISSPQALIALEAVPESLQTALSDSVSYQMALPNRPADVLTLLQDEPSHPPTLIINPDDLAYIAFTSGSTGQPKAVMGSHAALAHFIDWHTRTFSFNDSDRFSFLSGLAYDPALRDIFTPLSLGATLYIPEQARFTSPGWLANWMSEQAITVTHLTPPLLHLMLDRQTVSSPANDLRYIFSGGDVLTGGDVNLAESWAPNVTCVNFYGATETPQAMGYYVCAPGNVHSQNPQMRLPIGQGIEGVQLLVLNGAGQLTGSGELGEIYVRTPYLALGYLDDAPLTHERFIQNPFVPLDPADRLYRTGDLARYRTDGTIDFVGRADDQLKIRGYRIELSEVESHLREHEAIKEVVVTANADKHITAYIALQPGQALAEQALRTYLRQRLLEAAIPASFVFVEALPRLPSGKVDRQALSRLGPGDRLEMVAAQRSLTPVEGILATIWSEVLGREVVNVQDDFFSLGGHSLLMIQILSRVRHGLGVELPLRTFFEAPTIAQLTERINVAKGAGLEPQLQTVPRNAGGLPLSFAQQRLWFLDQLEPGNPLYNSPVALRIHGALNVAALEQAFTQLAERHEVLLTTIVALRGQPTQVVAPPAPVVLTVVDVSSEALALQAVQAEAQRPFNLATGPLWRVGLYRLSPTEHILTVTLHHIICDGWSMTMLVRDVTALYESAVQQQPIHLPELPIQYADFAVWQRSWLESGGMLERQLAYWKALLKGPLPVLVLPYDKPRPAVPTFTGAHMVRQLPAAIATGLTALSRQQSVTLYMLLLAVYKVLLAHYAHQFDILVGTPSAGRNRLALEGLIGFFVNTLVLRTDLSGNPTFAEVLRRVRAVTVEAYAHQDLPFEKLVEELRPDRSQGQSSLFQVWFVLQQAGQSDLATPDLTLSILPIESGVAKFDLSLSMLETPQGLTASLEYNTSVFEPATIARMLDHFEILLSGIIEQPNTRLDALNALLSQTERTNRLMKKKGQTEFNRKQFAAVQPKAIRLSNESLVKMAPAHEGEHPPQVIEPAIDDLNLISWAEGNKTFLLEELPKGGAILFHNFKMDTVEQFETLAKVFSPELADYYERTVQRSEVGNKIYTASEYAPDHPIPFHNEYSFSHRWPLKLWFFCVKPADKGGETTLADGRTVLEFIPAEIREEFIRKDVMYVRNYGEGLDLTWQHVFQTNEHAGVEEYCKAAGIEVEWKGDDRLRTRQIRPAVQTHPQTGETVWYNQATLFHSSSLDPATRSSLTSLFKDEDLPRHAFYGDGSPIPDSVLDIVRAAYDKATLIFPLARGDAVMIDNMLMAHGRLPFEGKRTIVVAMTDIYESRLTLNC